MNAQAWAVLAGVGFAVFAAGRPAAAGEWAEPMSEFFASHCLDCHSGPDGEGGLDLTTIGTPLADPANFARWVRIHDRVRDGEMPPADYGQPDSGETERFLAGLGEPLRLEQERQWATEGRVRGRRLTNHQLERTLQDLLAIDVPLASLMSEEPRHDGFTNVADHQSISHFHLESHLKVVDHALDAAFDRAGEDGAVWRRDYGPKDLARANPKKRNRDPEMREGLAVVWSSGLIFYGRITSTKVKRDGWYRVTFRASAVKKPADHGVWCSVRSGPCVSSAPLLNWVGSFEATDEPQEWTFETWIPSGQMLEIRPADAKLKRARFQGGQVGVGEGEPQDVPGVALHSMTIERIHPGGDVADVRERLFGDLPMAMRNGRPEVDEAVTAEALRAQWTRFASRAFRRPASDSELARYDELARAVLDSGQSPTDALRAAYRAILCSPRFLYFQEPVGALDGHAIASRLSYLIGNTMPDPQLRRLADEGRLADPDTIRQEVDRLLGTDRGRDFVRDFAGQWLDLVDIDFTEPDRKLYPDFDIVVQNAMLAETHAFLQDLLDRDASVGELLAADYTFLNSRLARFYGLDGVVGDAIRRVALPDGSPRGGLLAHGSILKVTANGTDTSPVLRGVWVSERLLGQPIPPPPENVPAVEPDIRGATTIRELLEKHKSDSSCAGCHRKIDPPGYALENFDAAGRWRDTYVRLSGGRPRPGAVIDASETLPDGRAFAGFDEFRRHVSSDVPMIAKNLAEKWLVYGTGGPVSFADREDVGRIVARAAEHDFGFRSLLHAVATSPTFLTK